LSLRVRSSAGTAISPKAATMARNCARNRIQITCAAGSPENVPRYFAVVSRQANSAQAMHIRPMARSGLDAA
jgi:hypothetical protein